MDDSTHNIDPLFIKGFNSGYLIQKHEEKLMTMILKGLDTSESAFLNGIKAGSSLFKKEKFLEAISKAKGKENQNDNDRDFGLEHSIK